MSAFLMKSVDIWTTIVGETFIVNRAYCFRKLESSVCWFHYSYVKPHNC